MLAAGVEALAMSITREDGPAHHSDPPVSGIDDGLGARGLRGMGQMFEILADGNEALRRLDRDELDRSLSLVSPETAALAGVWSVRAALAGWRAALWGDLAAGLDGLSTGVARLSIVGREQDEPMGSAMLSRARVLLLTKAGAFGAATQAVASLPEAMRLVPQSRIHLWAGQFKQAIRLADGGPYQMGLEISDRYRLRVVRAAAALLDGTCDQVLRADAVREVKRLLPLETFVHLALLPKPARDALLDIVRPELTPGEIPDFDLLDVRLAQLNDAGFNEVRLLHLTDREEILLPMLATEDSVPEIARKLQVSVNTVRKQVATLREKFTADTRAELVRRATTYGAIP